MAFEIVDEKSGGGFPSWTTPRTQGVKNIKPITAKNKIRGARAHKFVPDSMNDQATVTRRNIPYTESAL